MSVRGDERMVAFANDHEVAAADEHRLVTPAVRGVHAMEPVALRMAKAEIVDLFEIGLGRRTIGIVFVRRIARPVAGRRQHFADHEAIGGKPRRQNVDDLARCVAAAADLEAAVARTDERRGAVDG